MFDSACVFFEKMKILGFQKKLLEIMIHAWWLFVPQPKKDKEWLTKGGRRSESEDAK
jgi:hypothetical protein